MKKNCLFYVLILSIIPVTVFSQKEMVAFWEEYTKTPYLDSLENVGDYETYISELKGFQRIDNNFSNNLNLAYAYMYLDDTTNAIHYLQQAVETGYQIDKYFPYFDTILFSSVMPTIYSQKDKWRQTYYSSLDTILLNELHEMISNDQIVRNLPQDKEENIIRWRKTDSLNQARLKEIVQEGGWPDLTKRGHYRYNDKFNDLSLLIVHHLDPEDIIYYLNLSIESCKQNKEQWSVSSSIMKDLLFRKEYPAKLRYLKINQEDGSIDLEESALFIYSLASFMQSNPYFTITIRPCSNYKWENPEIEILKLKEALIKMGLERHRVETSWEFMKEMWADEGYGIDVGKQIEYSLEKYEYQDDGLGEYFFIYEYPRKIR